MILFKLAIRLTYLSLILACTSCGAGAQDSNELSTEVVSHSSFGSQESSLASSEPESEKGDPRWPRNQYSGPGGGLYTGPGGGSYTGPGGGMYSGPGGGMYSGPGGGLYTGPGGGLYTGPGGGMYTGPGGGLYTGPGGGLSTGPGGGLSSAPGGGMSTAPSPYYSNIPPWPIFIEKLREKGFSVQADLIEAHLP